MENNLKKIRHSLAHVLAAAVYQMFPEAKFGIGPVIENGFYYDFELPRTLIPEDLEIIEGKMCQIIKKGIKFEAKEVKVAKAKKFFAEAKQPYKVELVEELEKEGKKEVTIYKTENFVDLCSGPHVESTKDLQANSYKLTSIAGAYWRGDEKNTMLQRIYGMAFANEKELNNYLELQEETKKRDHRKIGKDLDLFVFSDLVGAGLPLYTPRGTTIKEELQKEVETICRRYGFEKVMTPHLAKIDLYKISGHAEKFADELFHVKSVRGQKFVMKPVQCPHQTQIYASRLRSYRELPIRYMESEKQYRAEKPGEISGLNRVIAITIEDGHSFCRVDQVKEEIKIMVDIIKDFYSSLGMWGNHWVSFSVRDYAHQEQYIGEPKDWDSCERILEEVSNEMKLNAVKREGEAALYGPKLDFMFKDALGREIQIPTVQLDFATPKRFGLEYIDEKGKVIPPVMVHRAILGSYERFIALILEHFNGLLPLWLAPEQIRVLPISDKVNDYASKVVKMSKEFDIRTNLDDSNESLGKKIRNAELEKVPYMFIVGEKEKRAGTVSVRHHSKGVHPEGSPRGDLGSKKLEEILKILKKEIEEKKIN